MKTTYCLVYQGGIANVFEETPRKDTRSESVTGLVYGSDRQRILQSDFKTCEIYCRGLRKGGQMVRVAWCNQAGDITNEFWNFAKFGNAPFHESFASDFVIRGIDI